MYSLVLEAVNTLSPKNRTATLLFYQEQLSLNEIAALLNVSVAAIKGRLHKSRIQLRAQLLPLYAESDPIVPSEQRRSNMIEVTIADVIPQPAENTQSHVVVLWDRARRKILPIWVGRWEGESIALGLTETSTLRPMTYKFMANLLEAAGTKLESVRVETIKETTFYAVVSLRNGNQLREVDARPSDALALALHTKSPIYVAQELLEREGVELPAEIEQNQFGKGLDSLKKQRELQKRESEEKQRACQSSLEEVKQKAYQELIALLFDSK